MLRRSVIWIAWLGIVLLGSWLRLHDLSEAPIHADEATGARFLAQQLEGETYKFNPQHFHGPWLSVSTIPFAKSRGERNWQELRLITLRSNSALAGILLTLTPLLWLRTLGPYPALVASSLLATSPLLVYYSRIYIHESWLAFFGMLALTAVYHLWARPTVVKGMLAGIAIGLMFSTKATVAISILSWGIAIGIAYLTFHRNTPKLKEYLKPSLCTAAVALLTAAIFYTNGFRNPQGLLDAFQSYFVYETTPGHDKPFTYFFHLLLWPKHQLGLWWSEALIVILAIFAGARAVQLKDRNPCLYFLSIAAIAHLAIYACIDYKTPWLMLLPWAHVCLIGGAAFIQIGSAKRTLQISTLLLLGATLTYQIHQSLHATGRLASDERTPYSYVPTTKDPQRIANWIEEIRASQGTDSLNISAVVGNGYWPLPWYLRGVEQVGYWTEPAANLKELPLAFSMPAQEANCDQILSETHQKFPRSLRSNVPLLLYLRNDIWQNWSESEQE